jgi:hypothetical protein
VERGEEEEVVMVAEAVDAGWNKVTLVDRCGVSTGAYRGMKGGRVRIGVTLPEPAGDLTTAAHSGMFVAKSKTASDLSSRLTAS